MDWRFTIMLFIVTAIYLGVARLWLYVIEPKIARRRARRGLPAPVGNYREQRRLHRKEDEARWLAQFVEVALSGERPLGFRYLHASFFDERGKMIQRELEPETVRAAVEAKQRAYDEPVVIYHERPDGVEVVVKQPVNVYEQDGEIVEVMALGKPKPLRTYSQRRLLRVDHKEVARWTR